MRGCTSHVNHWQRSNFNENKTAYLTQGYIATLGYALYRGALASLTPDELDYYEERAAIMEYDANMTREEAEQRALEMVVGRRKPEPKQEKLI